MNHEKIIKAQIESWFRGKSLYLYSTPGRGPLSWDVGTDYFFARPKMPTSLAFPWYMHPSNPKPLKGCAPWLLEGLANPASCASSQDLAKVLADLAMASADLAMVSVDLA